MANNSINQEFAKFPDTVCTPPLISGQLKAYGAKHAFCHKKSRLTLDELDCVDKDVSAVLVNVPFVCAINTSTS